MKFAILPSPRRRAATVLLAACLLSGLPVATRAAEVTNATGVQLLEAELLPGKVPLRSVKCDPLVIAVGKTTLAHPRDAVAILDAALARRVRKFHDDKVATLPCACARRIFLASIAAAPRRSSELLDLALELYPDCAPEFAGALSDFNAGRGAFAPGAGSDGENTPGSSAMNNPLGDSMFNPVDPDDGGFGVGFGPGFPGSPGFTGSGPAGGIALPPGVVTAVLNG